MNVHWSPTIRLIILDFAYDIHRSRSKRNHFLPNMLFAIYFLTTVSRMMKVGMNFTNGIGFGLFKGQCQNVAISYQLSCSAYGIYLLIYESRPLTL